MAWTIWECLKIWVPQNTFFLLKKIGLGHPYRHPYFETYPNIESIQRSIIIEDILELFQIELHFKGVTKAISNRSYYSVISWGIFQLSTSLGLRYATNIEPFHQCCHIPSWHGIGRTNKGGRPRNWSPVCHGYMQYPRFFLSPKVSVDVTYKLWLSQEPTPTWFLYHDIPLL